MYRAATLLAVVVLASVFPSYVQAQQAEISLLRREAMQEELGITPEQKEKLDSIYASWAEGNRAAMAELGLSPSGVPSASERQRVLAEFRKPDNQKKLREARLPNAASHYEKLKEVLKPEQMRRLREVAIQYTGSLGSLLVNNPDIAKELGLSDDQEERIADAFFNAVGVRAASGTLQERNKGVLAILTDDQRSSLEGMKGKPFDIEKLRITRTQRPPFNFFLERNDKNSDGKITESEATVWFWSFYGEFDTNKDGAVDKEEFAKAAAQLGVRGGPGGAINSERFMNTTFARFDENNDGKLTQSETTERFWSTFGEFDTNKDDAVDKDEFTEGISKRAGRRLVGVSFNSTAGGPGLLVRTVRDGAPAAAAGIKVGDRFLEVDGKKVSKREDFREAVSAGGKKLTLVVLREGEQLNVTVTFEQ